MEGYDDTTYGESFADVYDEWYGAISDVDATVSALADLANRQAVLELGVGTGRLAVPLAEAGVAVTGIDTSTAMLARLADRDREHLVHAIHGSMVDDLPDGPFGLAFVAYNTLFNLRTAAEQQACFVAVARCLAPGGRFAVETFVADPADGPADDVSVRSVQADRVVLSISVRRPADQVAEGSFVEFTQAGGVRMRPWSIRYSTLAELDAAAIAAGFTVEHRWLSFAREPFSPGSDRHVTVYRLPPMS
ncbi:MAG: class I SAM-dependent methyltransferase [Ilumatobacteraceae bacterium]